jgi:hypothetical protein
MSPNTHIIDMSTEALEDLNDALEDEGLNIEFGHDDGFAFYRCHAGSGASTARVRIEPFTTASGCWQIARDLFPDPFPV